MSDSIQHTKHVVKLSNFKAKNGVFRHRASKHQTSSIRHQNSQAPPPQFGVIPDFPMAWLTDAGTAAGMQGDPGGPGPAWRPQERLSSVGRRPRAEALGSRALVSWQSGAGAISCGGHTPAQIRRGQTKMVRGWDRRDTKGPTWSLETESTKSQNLKHVLWTTSNTDPPFQFFSQLLRLN